MGGKSPSNYTSTTAPITYDIFPTVGLPPVAKHPTLNLVKKQGKAFRNLTLGYEFRKHISLCLIIINY